MRRIVGWVTFILFISILGGASSALAEARIALLIGNQGYSAKVGPLKNPHNDVNLIEASLKRLGFKVTVLKDANYKAMDSALKRHVTEVRRAGRETISFFYYSGHGVANPETQINYLIPIDVADADDDRVWFESFQQTAIIDLLNREAPNATHYVVFDACRNELKISGTAVKALGTDKGFVPVMDTAGLLIAYATAPRKTASDVGEGGGPYAKTLAEELLKPGIEAVSMFRNVQIRVKEAIGQDPWLSFPSLPPVFLAGKPGTSPALTTAAVQVHLNEAAEAWDKTKDTTNVATLEAFIRRFGESYYGDLAKARLDGIRLPDLTTTDCQVTRATDVAARACSEIIAKFPAFAMAYAVRGSSYRRQRDQEQALADFTRALELDPKNAYALSRRISLFAESTADDARREADFDRIIAIAPTGSIDFEALGLAYAASKKDFDRAISAFNRAIQLDPKFVLAYSSRGNAYRAKRDYDRAIADHDKAIELDPTYPTAYNNRGNVYSSKQDYDRAIVYYNKAIELEPTFAVAYLNRGNSYRSKQDYVRAFADYNKAIELDPKYVAAYNNRGIAYGNKKDYDRAIADYNKAIELDSKYAAAYTSRGLAYYNKQDYDRAIADYNKALELDPKFTIAYNNRGIAYGNKKDYDRAIADYDKAIELDPKYAAAYTNRGMAYYNKQDYDRAIADYNKALELDPKFTIAYNNRGIAYGNKKDYDRAIADYDKAIELDPKYAAAYNNRGMAYGTKQDYDHAIADFDKAIEHDPKYTNAYNNRGVTYGKRQDHDRAI